MVIAMGPASTLHEMKVRKWSRGTIRMHHTLSRQREAGSCREGHSRAHFSFAYSDLASFSMGMSGSASFQREENEEQAPFLLWQPHFTHQLGEAQVRTQGIE